MRSMISTVLLTLAIVPFAVAVDGPIQVRTGIVQLIDRTELAAEDSGLLASLEVKLGDQVQAGDVIAVLKDQEAKLAMDQAALELKHARIEADSTVEILRAEQQLGFRKVDWERAAAAAKSNPGAFSLSELDKKKLDYETAKLDVSLAREQQLLKRAMADIKQKAADQATHQWERRRIRAPMDGMVEQLDAHEGEWVQAGQRLMLIVNSDQLRVQGLVAVADYHPQLKGAKASVRIASPGLREMMMQGVVAFVSTENDPRTGDIRVGIDFDNADGLVRPGMQAVVTIERTAIRTPRR